MSQRPTATKPPESPSSDPLSPVLAQSTTNSRVLDAYLQAVGQIDPSSGSPARSIWISPTDAPDTHISCDNMRHLNPLIHQVKLPVSYSVLRAAGGASVSINSHRSYLISRFIFSRSLFSSSLVVHRSPHGIRSTSLFAWRCLLLIY